MGLDVSLIAKPIPDDYYDWDWDAQSDFMRENKLYTRYVTHNLGKMAQELGIYEYLWRPEEVGVVQAKQLIKPLGVAIDNIRDRKAHYRTFNPPNGFGTMDGFIDFMIDYLKACRTYPNAFVDACR